MPKITIIEPNDKLRASLKRSISNSPGWRLVGDHANAKTALACAPAEQPDVVVIDINLPGTNGLDGLEKLSKRLPEAFFIVFTSFTDRESVFLALKLGAHAYVLKQEGVTGLAKALRLAKDRKTYLSPEIATVVVTGFHNRPVRLGIFRRLTSRQMQVVRMVHQGLPYSEIAKQMGITEQGVRQHLHRIYTRLRIKRRAELMALYGRMLNGELGEEE